MTLIDENAPDEEPGDNKEQVNTPGKLRAEVERESRDVPEFRCIFKNKKMSEKDQRDRDPAETINLRQAFCS